MDNTTEVLLNMLFMFLFVILIFGVYVYFSQPDDLDINQEFNLNINNTMNYSYIQKFEQKPTTYKKQNVGDKIVVIFNDTFCEYFDDKENCYQLSSYSNHYKNVGFLNMTDYVMLYENNMTFIINDHIKTNPQVIIK